jgi:hypothetical protein
MPLSTETHFSLYRHVCNQSPFPRKEETLCEIGDNPVFRNQTIAESTRDHIAPHDLTTSGREALKVTLVGAPKRSLPGDSVLSLYENLDIDLEIRKGTLIHAEDSSDHIVPPSHVLVREMSDIVRCEKLANRFKVAVG